MEQNRRTHPRIKIKLPVEIFTEGSQTPIRGATSDLCLSGCYIENMFPLPVGAKLKLKLQAGRALSVLATVATSDPQVGNGINFTSMPPQDAEALRAFLEAAEKEMPRSKK